MRYLRCTEEKRGWSNYTLNKIYPARPCPRGQWATEIKDDQGIWWGFHEFAIGASFAPAVGLDKSYAEGTHLLTLDRVCEQHPYDSANLCSFLRAFGHMDKFTRLPLNRVLRWLESRDKCVLQWFIDNNFIKVLVHEAEYEKGQMFTNKVTQGDWILIFCGARYFNLLSPRFNEVWSRAWYGCNKEFKVTEEEFKKIALSHEFIPKS